MTILFKKTRIQFQFDGAGDSLHVDKTISLEHHIRNATVVLSGFQLRYTSGDHHVREQKISITDVQFEHEGTHISFRVNFMLRDDSGELDDPFAGFADIVIIADVS